MCDSKARGNHPGYVLVTLQRGKTIMVIKEVPANVCENCQEYYVSEEITGRLMELAEDAVERGAEIEVINFAA